MRRCRDRTAARASAAVCAHPVCYLEDPGASIRGAHSRWSGGGDFEGDWQEDEMDGLGLYHFKVRPTSRPEF